MLSSGVLVMQLKGQGQRLPPCERGRKLTRSERRMLEAFNAVRIRVRFGLVGRAPSTELRCAAAVRDLRHGVLPNGPPRFGGTTAESWRRSQTTNNQEERKRQSQVCQRWQRCDSPTHAAVPFCSCSDRRNVACHRRWCLHTSAKDDHSKDSQMRYQSAEWSEARRLHPRQCAR